jgi:hypothetical protein
MIYWIALNVLFPFLPLVLGWTISRVFGLKKPLVDTIADGQLYFFSVGLCGVFWYDAFKGKKLDADVFLTLLFAIVILMTFYAITWLFHSNPAFGKASQTGTQPLSRQQILTRLAWISVVITLLVIILIIYARFSLGLIS